MLDKELSRSACRIFGHRWEPPKYAAYRARRTLGAGSGLIIKRQRRCSRCGEVEAVERGSSSI